MRFIEEEIDSSLLLYTVQGRDEGGDHPFMARFIIALFMLFVILFSGAAAQAQFHKGQSITPFTLRDLQGKTFQISDYLGKYAVILWFTDFCDTCRAGFAQMEALSTQYGPSGLRIIAVSTRGEANADVQKTLTTVQITFPILIDQRGEVTVKFSGNFIAGTCPVNNLFILDRSGAVRFVRHFPGTPPDVLKEEIKNSLSH
jgi:peroxiredoxin